jgi:predicted DCC family thiol-disulfide oxidoreductase YuxK
MEIRDLPKDKKIILFDGVCNLCDRAVQYIVKHDKNDVFRFVQLQSDLGVNILTHIGVDPQKTDSIVLYEPGVAYHTKSGAALEIAKHLGWMNLGTVLKIVPKFLRDPLYDYIARNRYKWYGRKNECMIPTPEISSKFLA